MQNDSSAVAALLNPVNGYRGTLIQRGVVPKDHSRDNRDFIKSIQEHTQTVLTAPKAAYKENKLKQFTMVPSKVSTQPVKRNTVGKTLDYVKGKIETMKQTKPIGLMVLMIVFVLKIMIILIF